jgi:hypothetical protein
VFAGTVGRPGESVLLNYFKIQGIFPYKCSDGLFSDRRVPFKLCSDVCCFRSPVQYIRGSSDEIERWRWPLSLPESRSFIDKPPAVVLKVHIYKANLNTDHVHSLSVVTISTYINPNCLSANSSTPLPMSPPKYVQTLTGPILIWH